MMCTLVSVVEIHNTSTWCSFIDVMSSNSNKHGNGNKHGNINKHGNGNKHVFVFCVHV